MTSTRLLRRFAVLAVFALVAVACSSGGGGASSSDDAAAPAAGAATVGDRPVQFAGAAKTTIVGTLTVPPTRAGDSVAGVLVVPTGGTGDRNGLLGETGVNDPLARDLTDTFKSAGMATYRYDQRGTGQSKLDSDARLRLDDLVADARGALNVLAERRETAGRDLTVVGYDVGGLVALRLAASDDRVKRLVLISTPGRSLADVRAAQLTERYGPDSGDALRTVVAGLLATRTLPPLESLRTELRPLFPTEDAGFLADLYGMDPAADAARVTVPTMIVVPSDPAPYEPQRLATAIPGARVVTSAGSGSALLVTGTAPPDDPSSAHDRGMAAPVAPTKRDTAALDRISQFVTSPARP